MRQDKGLVGATKLRADLAWRQWAERQIAKRTQTVQRLESSGFYEGYDADIERHQVRLLSGRLVDAESLTTAGQAAGDLVAVSRAGSWRFKTMPRA